MRGAFQGAGQNCIGLERYIVHASLYDDFVTTMADKIRKFKIGSILSQAEGGQIDMGAIISAAAVERLRLAVDGAVKEGARLVIGGKPYQHPQFPVCR